MSTHDSPDVHTPVDESNADQSDADEQSDAVTERAQATIDEGAVYGRSGTASTAAHSATRDPQRSSTETASRADVTAHGHAPQTTCPECDGTLVVDEAAADRSCADCGLVVESNQIDHGAEWRVFDEGERDRKSRVGQPKTYTLHDKGLTTKIGGYDRDSYGRLLNASQRYRAKQLRKWQKRVRVNRNGERRLKEGLTELRRMSSALGVPDQVLETASVIFRRYKEETNRLARALETTAGAALYASARQSGYPRSLDEIAQVARVDRRPIGRAYREVADTLDLSLPPTQPHEYVSRIVSDTGADTETEQLARDLLDAGAEAGVFSGKSPVGLAAAAVYGAGLVNREEISQMTVSEAADVSTVTIRERYPELFDAAGRPTPDTPDW